MMYVNRVELLGRVVSFEKKELYNSVIVYNINFVTNSQFKDKDGKIKTEAEYHNLVAYNNNACDFLYKGALCFIEGRLKYEKYETKEGIKKNITKINVSKIILLNKNENVEEENNVKKYNTSTTNDQLNDFPFDDDIPL